MQANLVPQAYASPREPLCTFFHPLPRQTVKVAVKIREESDGSLEVALELPEDLDAIAGRNVVYLMETIGNAVVSLLQLKMCNGSKRIAIIESSLPNRPDRERENPWSS